MAARPTQTSPFAKAPADVLLHIFNITLTLENVADRFAEPVPLPVRWSHISSHVRSVVIGAPLIWTKLDPSILRSPAILTAFLTRSQECEIDIRTHRFIVHPVPFDEMKTGTFTVHPGPITSSLMANIHRWRSLRFESKAITIEEFQEFAQRLCTAAAPKLVELRLASFLGMYAVFRPTIILIGGSPALKSLYLMSNSFCLPDRLAI